MDWARQMKANAMAKVIPIRFSDEEHARYVSWRNGTTAACTEQGLIFELSALERSGIACAVTFDKVQGWEGVPKLTGDYNFGNDTPFLR